jgi:hypothetical protein
VAPVAALALLAAAALIIAFGVDPDLILGGF